jgi:hypothetical protein
MSESIEQDQAAAARNPDQSTASVRELVTALGSEELREVLSAAADRHDDVAQAVRLIAARANGELGTLREEIDRGLRTRRYLGYRESNEWARTARPVLDELRAAVDAAPSRELVELLQRAIGHVVKVIHHADDSSGLIGDLARDLLALHLRACEAQVADPMKLAAWMIRFGFIDQDFFEVDPVAYAGALGEAGLAAYRKAVAQHDDEDSFAARYARERLAILDGDTDAIITLLGGDLTTVYQFIRVAEAMAELGRDDDVLQWATRGITQTSGWQLKELYDLACSIHAKRDEPLEVLRLRRAQHERMPSLSTYTTLRSAAQSLDAWETERDAARSALSKHDRPSYIEALLSDEDSELAWQTAMTGPIDELSSDRWLRLASAREPHQPDEALTVYLRVVDEVLVTTDRRAYASAIRILKQARTAAAAAGDPEAFQQHIADLREHHRRRPTLIAMLDKAGFR